jgi:hypothetical protein
MDASIDVFGRLGPRLRDARVGLDVDLCRPPVYGVCLCLWPFNWRCLASRDRFAWIVWLGPLHVNVHGFRDLELATEGQ